jgi:hypothetical protein
MQNCGYAGENEDGKVKMPERKNAFLLFVPLVFM